jgi:hypothetical protein
MPKPKRKKGERIKDYRSRLIAHYRRTGRPADQAAAIAYRETGTGRAGRTKKRTKRRTRRT